MKPKRTALGLLIYFLFSLCLFSFAYNSVQAQTPTQKFEGIGLGSYDHTNIMGSSSNLVNAN